MEWLDSKKVIIDDSACWWCRSSVADRTLPTTQTVTPEQHWTLIIEPNGRSLFKTTYMYIRYIHGKSSCTVIHHSLCLHVHCRRRHSTSSAPPVKCKDLWVAQTRICCFLSDRLSFHLSSNFFYLHPLFISSGVSWAQLAQRDSSAAIHLCDSLLIIGACLCLLHICQKGKKNR